MFFSDKDENEVMLEVVTGQFSPFWHGIDMAEGLLRCHSSRGWQHSLQFNLSRKILCCHNTCIMAGLGAGEIDIVMFIRGCEWVLRFSCGTAGQILLLAVRT